MLLSRFVTERFLYRLSRSPHASRFVLKGATLMPLWLGETARPTRDADLAGFGDMSAEALATIFRDVFELEVEPDYTLASEPDLLPDGPCGNPRRTSKSHSIE